METVREVAIIIYIFDKDVIKEAKGFFKSSGQGAEDFEKVVIKKVRGFSENPGK